MGIFWHGRWIEAAAVVDDGYDNVGTLYAQLDLDLASAGVLCDIGQRLLNEAVNSQLNVVS